MKRIIMLMMVALILALSISTKLFAQDEEKCTCGTDEDGECLPCKE